MENRKIKNPYILVEVSECSVLVGYTDEEIIVAHISYSDSVQAQKVVNFMRRRGISEEHILAIVSVGKPQKDREEKSPQRRIVDSTTYLQMGILPDNLYPFEFIEGDRIGDSRKLYNLARVVSPKKECIKVTSI